MSSKCWCVVVLWLYLCSGSVNAKSVTDATPRDCYKSYNQTLYYAKDIKALIPYFTAPRQQLLKKMSKAQQVGQYKTFRSWYLSEPKFISEKVTGTKARLTIQGTAITGTKPYAATLNIDMARENSYWRIAAGTIKGVVRLN